MSTIIGIKFLAQLTGLEGYLYLLGYSKWKQMNIFSMNKYSHILWTNIYLQVHSKLNFEPYSAYT